MKPDRETTHVGSAGLRAGRALRRLREERGQAVTEFAMVVPLFAVLVIVCVLFGRALYDYIQLTHTANEAARIVAVDQPTSGSVCSYLTGVAALPAGVTIKITYPNPDAPSVPAQQAGEPVTVKASTNAGWVPIIGSTLDLSSSATMRLEQTTGSNLTGTCSA